MTDLQERVAALKWYHAISLPGGIVTPGWAPIAPEAYKLPEDLTGKRVLDVGAWDGYWSFEAAKRGAAHVVAIDDFSNTIHENEQRSWEQFDLCREALGYGPTNSSGAREIATRCERIELSVYDADEIWALPYDVIMCFGVLYHLRHPLLALDTLFNACAPGGLICIESAICNDYSPYRGGMGRGYRNDMVMEFYPGAEYGNNPTNWWVPTLRCLAKMVESCGFENVTAWKIENPASLPMCRGYVQATKKQGA